MSASVFLVAVAALVGISLVTRMVVTKGQLDALPPMPHEH